MADTLVHFRPDSAGTYYATRRDGLTGQYANETGSAWENYASGNWGDYAIAFAAADDHTATNPHYVIDMADSAWINGVVARLEFAVYLQAGASPAVSDVRQGDPAELYWDGAEFLQTAGALLSTETEAGLTYGHAMQDIWAATSGKSTGDGNTFRNAADTKDRIAATVDSSNNRTAITHSYD